MAYQKGQYKNAAYSYEEACNYLTMYKDALTALVDGQAQAYKIGSREVTLLDCDYLERMINKFAAIKEKYENAARPARNVAVVFRDT